MTLAQLKHFQLRCPVHLISSSLRDYDDCTDTLRGRGRAARAAHSHRAHRARGKTGDGRHGAAVNALTKARRRISPTRWQERGKVDPPRQLGAPAVAMLTNFGARFAPTRISPVPG